MWVLVIMISPTLLLADADKVGFYGVYKTQSLCEKAGKLFSDTGMTPTGSYIDKKSKTVSTCTQLHEP